ncbi:restriction endonuclease subunit S [Teredinibacter turnerae]|uniref:restriction endonuclease subunit S n=1 Tax=Teredinibacter turnerae TaxID=2426 RepID=UPI0030D62181
MVGELDKVAEASIPYISESDPTCVGRKYSEVGQIPADWAVLRLSEVVEPNKSICYGIVQTGPNLQDGVPCIRVIDIVNGKIDKSNLIHTSEVISASYKRTILKEGDLIVPLRGKVGEVGQVNSDLVGANLTRGVALVSPNADFDSTFVKYALTNSEAKRRFTASMNGSALQEITIDSLRNFQIGVPTRTEQTAIAKALSDMDALIESLEQLITKKRNLKQATMQQLLTGQTRLPQFALREDGTPKGYKQSELGEIPEDWEIFPLKEALSIRHGKSQKEVGSSDGDYPIMASGGQIGWANKFLWNKPSVLIGRKGTIDNPSYIDVPFWTVDTLFYSDIKEAHHAKFIFFKFCMIDWAQYNEASGVPSLSARTIEKLLVALPLYEEQAEISEKLSEIEREIDSLERRKMKCKQIKTGMMQELLTGKTRLI